MSDSVQQQARVRLPDDVNGDGGVDLSGVIILLNAFGSYLGHSRWNSAVDMDQDLRIDMGDVTLALLDFGKTVL